jgi:hypothetical protein
MLEDMPRTRHMLARIFPSLFGLRRGDVAPPRPRIRDGAGPIELDTGSIPPEQRGGGAKPPEAHDSALPPREPRGSATPGGAA